MKKDTELQAKDRRQDRISVTTISADYDFTTITESVVGLRSEKSRDSVNLEASKVTIGC